MSHPPAASWTPEPLPRPESPRDDAPPVARRRRRWPWVVGVLAVLLAELLGGPAFDLLALPRCQRFDR